MTELRLGKGKSFVQGHRTTRGTCFKPRLTASRPHTPYPAAHRSDLLVPMTQPGHTSVTFLTLRHISGESGLPVVSVEKQDRTPGHVGCDTEHGMPAVVRAHMQRAGPLACGCSVAGLVWSRAERHDGGGSRGSRLPTHFLCTLRIKPWAHSTVWLTQ